MRGLPPSGGWTLARIIRHVKHQTSKLVCNYFNGTHWFVGLHTHIKHHNALLLGNSHSRWSFFMDVDNPGLGHNIAGYFNLLYLSHKMMEWLVQWYNRCRQVRKHYRIEPCWENKKYDAMIPYFRFYSSKPSAFKGKYLGSDYCKID